MGLMNIRRIKLAIFRRTGIHTWLPKFLRIPNDKKWVFIVGCYNSGTTLVNNLLSQHPSISGLPYEGVSLTRSLSKPEDYGHPRMWWKCINEMQTDPARDSEIVSKVKQDWYLCFEPRKPIFLEKSIANSARIPWFKRNFQNAFFIHILRNGYAVAEGIRRKTDGIAPGGIYPIEDCIKQWSVSNIQIRKDLLEIQGSISIRYEDLCSNPAGCLNQICKFLDIRQIDWKTENKISVHGRYGSIYNMNDDSVKRLSHEDIDKIRHIAGGELQYYGYELI